MASWRELRELLYREFRMTSRSGVTTVGTCLRPMRSGKRTWRCCSSTWRNAVQRSERISNGAGCPMMSGPRKSGEIRSLSPNFLRISSLRSAS